MIEFFEFLYSLSPIELCLAFLFVSSVLFLLFLLSMNLYIHFFIVHGRSTEEYKDENNRISSEKSD